VFVVALVLGLGCGVRLRDLPSTCHRNLRSGSVRKWWEVAAGVRVYASPLWSSSSQPLGRRNGEDDYGAQHARVSAYLTPAVSIPAARLEQRRSTGELRSAAGRGILRDSGSRFGDGTRTARVRVVVSGPRTGFVTMDVDGDGYHGAEQVKARWCGLPTEVVRPGTSTRSASLRPLALGLSYAAPQTHSRAQGGSRLAVDWSGGP